MSYNLTNPEKVTKLQTAKSPELFFVQRFQGSRYRLIADAGLLDTQISYTVLRVYIVDTHSRAGGGALVR